MDLRKIKKLIELVEESGISELEVSSGEEAVRIVRPTPQGPTVLSATPADLVAAATAPAASAGVAADQPVGAADIEVRAPMAGTFYAAPEPGAAPFVSPGQHCDAEAVICIIESMKMMNEIRLPEAGQCAELLVANGEPISARQLLFRFRSGP